IELTDGRALELYSQPQRMAGSVVGRVWSLRDVTQRERAVVQRRVLAERFESAFGEAPIGMTIMQMDGTWLQVNRAMSELLGRPPEEILGKASDSITHPDDRAK